MRFRAEPGNVMAHEFGLVAMERERQRLCAAFRNRESLAVFGPRGSGKSRLLRECLPSKDILYLQWEPTLHALLVSIARMLIAGKHAEFLRRAALRLRSEADRENWLAQQPSVHLKGLLWNAMESSPVPMVFDGVTATGFPTYRFLQRLYHEPGMAIFASSRDSLAMGALARLFWNRSQTLHLAPLPQREAERLFEMAADRFQLRSLELDEFREKVLDSADGNPGQIIEMCRLASQPQYISGRYIKFTPLRIDTVIKFAG
jgi:hypothetical protein